MKPDHLFLSELTGDEVWHFIEILNTGTKGHRDHCARQ
nr:hypothetical protein pPsy0479a_00025 [Pseudomonas syringae]